MIIKRTTEWDIREDYEVPHTLGEPEREGGGDGDGGEYSV